MLFSVEPHRLKDIHKAFFRSFLALLTSVLPSSWFPNWRQSISIAGCKTIETDAWPAWHCSCSGTWHINLRMCEAKPTSSRWTRGYRMKAIKSLHGQKLEFRRPLCTCIDSYVSHTCLVGVCFHIMILEKKNKLGGSWSWFLLHESLPRVVHHALNDEINPESALNQA